MPSGFGGFWPRPPRHIRPAKGGLNLFAFADAQANRDRFRVGSFSFLVADDPSRLQFKKARTTVNVSASYQWRPWLEFSADLMNAFNEPHVFYRAIPDRISRYSWNGTTLTFSVSGRF